MMAHGPSGVPSRPLVRPCGDFERLKRLQIAFHNASAYHRRAREDCGDCGGGSSKRGWRGFAGASTGVERAGRACGRRGSMDAAEAASAYAQRCIGNISTTRRAGKRRGSARARGAGRAGAFAKRASRRKRGVECRGGGGAARTRRRARNRSRAWCATHCLAISYLQDGKKPPDYLRGVSGAPSRTVWQGGCVHLTYLHPTRINGNLIVRSQGCKKQMGPGDFFVLFGDLPKIRPMKHRPITR
jgi:hypothetical protein